MTGVMVRKAMDKREEDMRGKERRVKNRGERAGECGEEKKGGQEKRVEEYRDEERRGGWVDGVTDPGEIAYLCEEGHRRGLLIRR